MFKILLVEDDNNLRNLLSEYLGTLGYKVKEASSGVAALDLFLSEHFDLLISDIMMPGMDGNDLVSKIKRHKKDMPVIMLTALDHIVDKAKSFENGADDYMTKPIHFTELKLRISALLRRYKLINEKILSHKRVQLDYDKFSLIVADEHMDLTKKEFLLLYKLMSSPDTIFTRQQLLNEIWGYDTYSIDRTIDVHINKIREKMDCDDVEIQAIRGLGYKAVLK